MVEDERLEAEGGGALRDLVGNGVADAGEEAQKFTCGRGARLLPEDDLVVSGFLYRWIRLGASYAASL